MLYFFNNKSHSTVNDLIEGLKAYIVDELKNKNIKFKQGTDALSEPIKPFVDQLLEAPQPPNPIKHPSAAANLIIYLNSKHFKIRALNRNNFNKTEQLTVVCYRSQDPNKITIEVKLMLVRIGLHGDELFIALNEI